MNKKIILIGSLLAVFLMLMIPSVSAVEYNQVMETRESKILEYKNNNLLNEIKQKLINLDDYTLETDIEFIRLSIALFLCLFGGIFAYIGVFGEVYVVLIYDMFAITLYPLCLLTGDWGSLEMLYEQFYPLLTVFISMFYPILMGAHIFISEGEISFSQAYEQAISDCQEILSIIQQFMIKPPS